MCGRPSAAAEKDGDSLGASDPCDAFLFLLFFFKKTVAIALDVHQGTYRPPL